MSDLNPRPPPAEPVQLALDGCLVPDQDDRHVELLLGGDGPLDDHGRAMVAAHGVHGDLQRASGYVPSTATISRPL
jgi:hypothetical protein